MRCTDCGKPVKPIVAVDIDGTLGQYHRHFLEFAGQYNNSYYPPTYAGIGELHDHMKISLAEYRTIKLAYRQGGGKRMMPIFPGAATLLHELRMAGAEIWLTTTRPYNKFDSTDPDTLFWLRKHSLQWDHLLYDGEKYQRLAQTVDVSRVVAVIDDLHENLIEAEQCFPDATVYKRETEFNKGWIWKPVIRHLGRCEQIIGEVNEWYYQQSA